MQSIKLSLLRAVAFCAALLAIPTLAAQETRLDPLAPARAKAAAQNQRVLLFLNGGNAKAEQAMVKALSGERALRRQVLYEYQLAAWPAASAAGTALRKQLSLSEIALPALVKLGTGSLDTGSKVLGTLAADQVFAAGKLEEDRLLEFLQKDVCAPMDARKVLAGGLARAKKTERSVFVYLSAPW